MVLDCMKCYLRGLCVNYFLYFVCEASFYIIVFFFLFFCLTVYLNAGITSYCVLIVNVIRDNNTLYRLVYDFSDMAMFKTIFCWKKYETKVPNYSESMLKLVMIKTLFESFKCCHLRKIFCNGKRPVTLLY